ncbi:MAG: hypothetical protein ACT4QF_20025 [Sporichthyaceae bacterium]
MNPQSDSGQPQFGQGPQPFGAPPTPPSHPGAGTTTIVPPDATAHEDDMPLPKGRGPASTKALAVGLLVVLAFGGGVLAQKKNDEGMIRPPTGPAAAIAAAAAAGGGGAPAPAPGAPGEHPLLAGAALKGEVVRVEGTTLIVRDANGVERKATTSSNTLTMTQVPLDSLQPGQKVYVAGQPAADGSVTGLAVVVPSETAAPAAPAPAAPAAP